MSNFVVSARKYRPVRFVDVVGQQHVTNTLKNALRNDHLAHAFLFCGPRGVGKTTCARILAKLLNCQNPSGDFEPCDQCSSCQSFNENASFNITELDAASNNSVEHIRALIEQVRFQPQQGKYKVFIIDEVHMLSQQAFNAFLKTLEEPPSYAVFILATTEKHKIIPTILSRCQIFDFKRIQVPMMVEHLQQICKEEQITAAPEALHIIGQKADGALRDALSLFDRIVASASGGQISYEDVIQNLNVLDYDYFFRLVDALLMEDVANVLLCLDEVINKGFDPDLFINGLAEHLRDLLVCKDPNTLSLLEVGDSLRKRYQDQASKAPDHLILTALNLANDCDVHYKLARNKRLHVEMCLIKLCYINRAVRLSEQQLTANGNAPQSNEKKKPELSEGKAEMPDADEEMSDPTAEPPAADRPAEESGSQETEPNEAEVNDDFEPEVPKEPEQPASPMEPAAEQKRRSFGMPRIDDMDHMFSEAKKELKSEKNAPARPLTKDELQREWDNYVEQIPQESIKNMLRHVDLYVDNDFSFTIEVSSALVENTIREDVAFMDHLRSIYANDRLSMQIVVDKSKVEKRPEPRRPLSDKERLNQMNKQNQNVETLAKRFGLRFDEE